MAESVGTKRALEEVQPFSRIRILLLIIPLPLGALVWATWFYIGPFHETGILGLVLAEIGLLILYGLWIIPKHQVSHVEDAATRLKLENESRKTLAEIAVGLALLATIYSTWKSYTLAQQSLTVSQQSLALSQNGQITDRFTKAIDELSAVDGTGNNVES